LLKPTFEAEDGMVFVGAGWAMARDMPAASRAQNAGFSNLLTPDAWNAAVAVGARAHGRYPSIADAIPGTLD
jgi:hypothetical protein